MEAGAERAELQSKRGNQSANLVIAYCQKQTDYVPPEQKEIDDVLANVAMDYRAVVNDLEDALCLDVSELTIGALNGDVGEKWIFAKHYPELVERLCSKAKLSFIETSIKSALPKRSFLTDYGKRYFSLFDKAWESFIDDDAENWPVCVVAWEMREAVHGPGKFAVGIKYRHLSVLEEFQGAVQSALEDEFPELKKGRKNASYRMLGKTINLNESNVAGKVIILYSRLVKTLESAIVKIS